MPLFGRARPRVNGVASRAPAHGSCIPRSPTRTTGPSSRWPDGFEAGWSRALRQRISGDRRPWAGAMPLRHPVRGRHPGRRAAAVSLYSTTRGSRAREDAARTTRLGARARQLLDDRFYPTTDPARVVEPLARCARSASTRVPHGAGVRAARRRVAVWPCVHAAEPPSRAQRHADDPVRSAASARRGLAAGDAGLRLTSGRSPAQPAPTSSACPASRAESRAAARAGIPSTRRPGELLPLASCSRPRRITRWGILG